MAAINQWLEWLQAGDTLSRRTIHNELESVACLQLENEAKTKKKKKSWPVPLKKVNKNSNFEQTIAFIQRANTDKSPNKRTKQRQQCHSYHWTAESLIELYVRPYVDQVGMVVRVTVSARPRHTAGHMSIT